MQSELKKRILSSIIIIPITFFFIVQGSTFFLFFLSFLFLISSYEWIKIIKKSNIIRLIGIIFLFVSFYSAYHLRETQSLNFFFLILIICIFTDIGGYTLGKIFKGPKLSKISPNKTYTGMFGGFLFSLISGLFYIDYSRIETSLSTLEIFLCIIIISFIGQIGDLIISFFKRKAKIKDTGKLLPGHGGLLDRLDGIVFVFLFLYLVKLII